MRCASPHMLCGSAGCCESSSFEMCADENFCAIFTLQVEQEEEYLVNNLQRRLSEVRRQKTA